MDAQPTVFVIDDDPAIRESLQWLIESIGLTVKTYGAAGEFLQDFQAEMTGCLVLDIRLPDMSGLDLQDHLRHEGIAIPIIFVTGYGDVPTAVRAMKAGAREFLEKPVTDQDLLGHVQRAVAQDVRAHTNEAERRAVAERMKKLTRREREVIDLVLQGMSSKEIANKLNISYKTIEAHRAKIMKKMQAKSVPQLMYMSLGLHKDG